MRMATKTTISTRIAAPPAEAGAAGGAFADGGGEDGGPGVEEDDIDVEDQEIMATI